MPQVELSEETLERLDALRIDDMSYDEVVTELIDIYEAEGLTIQYGGDAL
ncbi:hypothetical protein [Halosegnis sp.]